MALIRNPRLWLYVAGGWLVVGGLGQLALHVWDFVLENRTSAGLWEFAMNAMKQARTPDLLRPSMWRLFRLYGVGLSLLWLFAGIVDLVLALSTTPRRLVATLALIQTVFWTLAFVPFAFVDPVELPLLVVSVAVPLHGIAYLTAAADDDPDDR